MISKYTKEFKEKIIKEYFSWKAGGQEKVAPNIVDRDFTVTKPNRLWLTDITEFRIKGQEEKKYILQILDVYNGEIISYTISNYPTIELTNTMLENALRKITEADKEELIIHSD